DDPHSEDEDAHMETDDQLRNPPAAAASPTATAPASNAASPISTPRRRLQTLATPIATSSHLAVAPPVFLMECPHCLSDRPQTATKPAFICTSCARRSDKPIDDSINKELRRAFEESVRTGALRPATDAVASSSSGQSKGDMRAASTPTGSANDRLCDAELARGGDFPLFVGPQAGAPLTSAEALERVRLALHGQMYERPPAKLVEVVRAGKLHHIGWAVPRRLDTGPTAASAASQLDFVDGRLVFAGAEAKKTFQFARDSVQQFAAAMFSTIIPALIDRPEALMQWVTLGRTALELEKAHNWAAASTYMAQLLQERVTTHMPFDAVSQQVLASVYQLRLQAAPDLRGAQRSSAAPSVSGQVCNNFNDGRCHDPCPTGRRHVCSRCNGDHPAKACNRASTTASGSGGGYRGGSQSRPPRPDGKMRSMPSLDAPAGAASSASSSHCRGRSR
ncbi:MAG: hypothetical protein P4M09_32365, partial [Devosia sp.]|nr:hypothetical protein [Devosia sp.]